MSKFSTLQKFTIILMVAFAGLAAYWFMHGGSGSNSRVAVTKSLVAAKKLSVACRAYALDHEGNFPPSLDALFPAYLTDRSALVSPLAPSEPVGYLYTPGGKYAGPVNAVVIEDKFASLLHLRIVAYVDGSARVLTPP